MIRLATALVIAGALWLAACNDAPSRPRKQQTVRLLPDTPPPPPPPKPEEQRPQAKPDDKPPPDAPKPDDAPQAQALKTDEAAGDGPGNGLASGAVTQDYTDQKLDQGVQVGGTAAGTSASLLVATAYGNATSRALNEYLVRDRAVKLRDYKVRIAVWLGPSGGLQRVELLDSTGDPATDEALRTALGRFPGTATPPPPGLPQPLRLQVSNRKMG